MKRLMGLICIMSAFLAVPAMALQGPAIGESAPVFKETDIAGESVTIGGEGDQLTVLEWTNHQCPFVRKHYSTENMQTLQKHAHKHGVEWITIISSAKGKQGHVSAEKAAEIAKERGAKPSHIIRDVKGEIGRAYGAKTTPHMYVVDKEGNIAYKGAIDSINSANPDDVENADNYVKAAIEALKAGEVPAKQVTRPYGCSVKY